MDTDRDPPAGARNAPEKLTREERLAARLRENLHRRKAQARALSAAAAPAAAGKDASPDSPGLSKSTPES